ncbi:MAG TPA: pyrroloquinoline quinone-dependent dehydrogenase [Bryobacteraceae bacterium]|jgi:quinoprotein glucose dehydrogenase|nr:pyrroloquinoline quinone-dependent dehydrogenase [Bryobacteraceae bacterium]
MLLRRPTKLASIAVALTAIIPVSSAQSRNKDYEWPTYNADLAGSRYRPLDQINASNFSKLEVAWRFKTDSIGNRPEFKLEGTPLMVNGAVYATAGSRRGVIALDAATGELLWVHGEHEGARGAAAPRQLSGRGLAYWSDGTEERILYVTPGYRLIALDAKTGALVSSFGKGGAVDLKLDDDQTFSAWNAAGEWLPDLTNGEVGLQSAPIVAKDTVIIGAAFREGMTPRSMRNNKGYVRGFDVRTGKRLWIFHTIPTKGEFGYDTWESGSAEYTGNTGVWTQITADEQLGLVYLPVESPTGDYYGGHRSGNNLFGESLVCVDLKTGKRKWHYQLVHHPLWDMDISSAPLLADVNVDGKPVKAVAVPSKQGFLYVFDRVTGKPVWPIEERAVEKGNVPGEWYAPTQPFPTKPPAYSRNGVTPDVLIDFTPAMHDQALTIVSKYHLGPVFTPPSASKVEGPLATLTLGTAAGGTNWPGGSFDPETHTVYVFACNACLVPIGLMQSPKDISDMNYISGIAGLPVRVARGPGENAGADSPPPPKAPPPAARSGGSGGSGFVPLSVDGLPLIKPPYGIISAINLDRGEIVWQTPHGDTPDSVRNHPALKGMDIPRTGQNTYNVGTLVTKTLVIAGDGQVTTTPEHPRGSMLRAYDKANGKEVGAVWMPAPQSGSPMTYMLNGKQYIIVAVSGGNYSGEYIAFTLPSAE